MIVGGSDHLIAVFNTKSFPYLGTTLTQHVKRFATSPLPMFEAEMAGTGTDVPEVMTATARCLAICVKVDTEKNTRFRFPPLT